MYTKKEEFEDIPSVSFGNKEVASWEDLGTETTCPKCAKIHKVMHQKGVNTTLAFVKCGESIYLVGIDNKRIKKNLP